MKIIKIFIIPLYIHLLFAYTLKGYIYDYNNFPLVNIEVVVDDADIQNVYTDPNGAFIINGLSLFSQICTININHFGYYPIEQKINIPYDEDLIIILKEQRINLNRIVITGTRDYRHIKNTPIITHVISKDDIDNSSYASIKDMLEIIMPNVQMVTSNHGDERVKFQGLDNKYMTFLVDGDRVSGEFAGNIDFSMLNLLNVEKIEIVEGAMSVLYGTSAIGGVVNIISKKNTSPLFFNTSLINDNPLVFSKSMNIGFNNKNIYYNFDIVYKNSNGYDLTPQSEFSKTLEEFSDISNSHNFIYKINENSTLEYFYKYFKSKINKYNSVFDIHTLQDIIIYDAPLSRYYDVVNKLKYEKNFKNSAKLKVVLMEETYKKKYFYPYYYNTQFDDYNLNGDEFDHSILKRSEFVAHYNYKIKNHKRLFGIEYAVDNYKTLNILADNGDTLHQSIFSGIDQVKKRWDTSIFFVNEWVLPKNDELSIGLRYTKDDKKDDRLLTSLSYLLKKIDKFNVRISYSSGYRKPSIKELYYQWTDHEPNIYGDSTLESTSNHYTSISFDKRTLNNDFSIVLYHNDLTNMISTEYGLDGLYYKNYDKVLMYGINMHYSRKIDNNSTIRFVYNYTYPSSKSNEILEGISKHAFRMNYVNELIENKLKMILNIKYSGKKFNFDQEEDWIGDQSIKYLDAYMLTDIIISYYIKSNINLKFGIKNVFDYKDKTRFDVDGSNILNSYDPGKRLFLEFSFSNNKGNVNE